MDRSEARKNAAEAVHDGNLLQKNAIEDSFAHHHPHTDTHASTPSNTIHDIPTTTTTTNTNETSSSSIYYEQVLSSAASRLSIEPTTNPSSSASLAVASTAVATPPRSSSWQKATPPRTPSAISSSEASSVLLNHYGEDDQNSQQHPHQFPTQQGQHSQIPTKICSPHSIHSKSVELTEEEVAKLSSLPQRPVSNFPSADDRKRIVGCLAAVLSMMYDHESKIIDIKTDVVEPPDEDITPNEPIKVRTSETMHMLRRYRRRRHRVYATFLESAASLLLLEKSNAIAFLPLLQPLQNTMQNSTQTWYDNDLLQPFLESLTPGAGFQCLSLLLLNHLLQNGHGYDARIRHVMKKLGVVIIVHEMKRSEYDTNDGDSHAMNGIPDGDTLAEIATRKFEALEQGIAMKLIRMSLSQQGQEHDQGGSSIRIPHHSPKRKGESTSGSEPAVNQHKNAVSREKIMRGLKIGSAGIAAGTLFAVTGGLAAPGIAAGLAASGFTATAATAGIVTTLTSTTAVTTIFGVGGGALASYKTGRRLKGVTEFSFQKETASKHSQKKDDAVMDAELFTTVCLSGWLKDKKDFQRPWGVDPSIPPITDRVEKLTRFYSIYKPENVNRVPDILKQWKGEERKLWSVLKAKYGRDPDNLYPINHGVKRRNPLTHEEHEIIEHLFVELGYAIPKTSMNDDDLINLKHSHDELDESLRLENSTDSNIDDNLIGSPEKPWDYHNEFGGELYTVRWESDLLMELCDSVTDMALDLVGTAAKEVLKQTALATLITAIAWPYAFVKAADMIDGTWTLAIERSDLAGIELAKCLLESQAGHRPVVLVGYSMGARTVYSCLKELARHQEIWEEQREKKRGILSKKNRAKREEHIQYTREPASIVEDAILMGTPNHMSVESWEACRTVVTGRLINCYSRKDLILSLMFQINRLAGALKPVCGTTPVQVPGVENYDVGCFISSHSDYCVSSGDILRLVRHGQPYRANAKVIIRTSTYVS